MLSLRFASIVAVLSCFACGDDGGASATESSGGTGSSSTDTTGSGGVTGTSEGPPTEATGAAGSSSSGDATTGEPLDIDACLGGIAGLTVTEQPGKVEGYRFFQMSFAQPVDHGDPEGASFEQRVTLMHRDQAAPLVLTTEGYFLNLNLQGLSEPANLLHGNQLRVEHRMFAGSVYVDADWSTLTIEQAATDHHRVMEALRPCYDGPRIATGASKSGMAATYFRRFFPDDVDVTVPYVAPLSLGTVDLRYVDFVNAVGEPSCRAALADAQRELLLRRDAMLLRIEDQAQQNGYTYDLLGEQFVLEVMALEMPFTFWQYFDASLCPTIPSPAATDGELWDFYEEIMPASSAEDQRLLGFEPYYWQAAVQLGGPAVDETGLADLLMFPGKDVPASFVFTPTAEPAFDAAVMPDIAAWVAAEGDRMLFVYGENDPWSAGAYDPKGAADVHVLVAPAGNHGSKIADLAQADRDFALAKLEAWTGIKPFARPLPGDLPLREQVGLDP